MDAVSYAHADGAHKKISKFVADPRDINGIVTLPKVIQTGSNVTIPTNRQIVVRELTVENGASVTLEGTGEIFVPNSGAGLTLPVMTTDSVKTQTTQKTIPTDNLVKQVGGEIQDIDGTKLAYSTLEIDNLFDTQSSKHLMGTSGSASNWHKIATFTAISDYNNFSCTLICRTRQGASHLLTIGGEFLSGTFNSAYDEFSIQVLGTSRHDSSFSVIKYRLVYDNATSSVILYAANAASIWNLTWFNVLHFSSSGVTVVFENTDTGTTTAPTGDRVLDRQTWSTDWFSPTLNNGWVDYGTGYDTCQYMKDGEGNVHIKGLVKNGTAEGLFVLPVGYRPITNRYTTHSLSSNGAGRMIIVSTGGVLIYNYSATNDGFYVVFKAEQ